jgi:hypothetical protein
MKAGATGVVRRAVAALSVFELFCLNIFRGRVAPTDFLVGPEKVQKRNGNQYFCSRAGREDRVLWCLYSGTGRGQVSAEALLILPTSVSVQDMKAAWRILGSLSPMSW